MTDAEATVRSSILSAIIATSPKTGLAYGLVTDLLVQEIVEEIQGGSCAWAYRELSKEPSKLPVLK